MITHQLTAQVWMIITHQLPAQGSVAFDQQPKDDTKPQEPVTKFSFEMVGLHAMKTVLRVLHLHEMHAGVVGRYRPSNVWPCHLESTGQSILSDDDLLSSANCYLSAGHAEQGLFLHGRQYGLNDEVIGS